MGISGTRMLRFAVVTILLGPGLVLARTQSATPLSPSPSTDPMHQKNRDEMDMPNEVMAKQSRARNDERQRRLVSDTDKLLALATSLHDDVAKTNKDVMSLDVIKRAEEIEKLAKSVKDRMKG